jgi:surface polysaccharide O-acyltransferase-like enzyme
MGEFFSWFSFYTHEIFEIQQVCLCDTLTLAMSISERITSFDLIRILATIGVIAIHTDVITSSPTNYLGGVSWWFANTIHSLAVVSVPLFAMLSGALVLNKESLSYAYAFKKASRFLGILLLWLSLYVAWNFFWLGIPISPSTFINNLATGNIGHLYYLLIVIGLYLWSPLLHKYFTHVNSKKQILFLVLLSGVVISHELASFLVFKNYNTTNMLVICLPFLVYFSWGYYLKNVVINQIRLVLLAGVIGLLTLVISVATYFNTQAWNDNFKLFWTPTMGNFLWEPFTPQIVLLSLMCFVFILNFSHRFSLVRSQKAQRLLKYISDACLGIYLIHPIVIALVDHYLRLSIHLITYPLWTYYLQKMCLVFCVSLLCITLVSKIPPLKKYVGYN